jgi:hypothetical protein
MHELMYLAHVTALLHVQLAHIFRAVIRTGPGGW